MTPSPYLRTQETAQAMRTAFPHVRARSANDDIAVFTHGHLASVP